MGLPSIIIAFKTAGIAAISRSDKGTVALLLRGEGDAPKTYTIYDQTDIPEGMDAAGAAHIRRALIGYIKPPKQLLVRIGAAAEDDLTEGLDWLATQQFDYMAGPPDISSAEAQAVASWIKNQRENNHQIYKAVLPNMSADHEGIINVTTGMARSASETLDAAMLCARIAGLIAGTPMKISCTYAPLPELIDCTRLSRAAADAAVDKGEFILLHDGQKVKVGRGVNSFVTTIDGKGDAFKKIKIVECMDMIGQDIRRTAEDSYIGKYANSYDNKCLLLTAIDGYLESLFRDGLIADGWTVTLDIPAIRTYLKSHGTDVTAMTDDEIKQADTGSWVFIRVAVKILDAIEDIDIQVTI